MTFGIAFYQSNLSMYSWYISNDGDVRSSRKVSLATQSRQSAKRFSSRWNWNSPTHLAAGDCAPPPFGPGERAHSLAAKGVGESQFQRGDIHCGAEPSRNRVVVPSRQPEFLNF
jgi:hypothetical protein